jgi:hypothetical protein
MFFGGFAKRRQIVGASQGATFEGQLVKKFHTRE